MHKWSWLMLMFSATFLSPARADGLPWNGTLSRAQAIERVTSAGFDVRIARADAAMAAAQALSLRAALLPQLSASGIAMDVNLPQLSMVIARQTYGTAYVTVPILALSAVFAARSGADEAAAAQEDLAMVRNDAALAAAQAYDRAELARAVADVRQTAVVEQRENLRLTKLRVSTGKMARYELARARASLANAEQMAEDAAAERDQSIIDLKVILDFDLASTVTLIGGIGNQTLNDTVASAQTRALRQHPQIAAAQSRELAARHKLAQARAAYLPTGSVSMQTYNGVSTPPLGTAGSQVSATLSLPIFDGGSRTAAVREAQAGLDKASTASERAQLQVAAAVADAWREYEAAGRNLQTAQSAQADALENLRVAKLRRAAGKGIELEVLDALAVAAQAREGVLRALTRYDLAIAGVHHAAADAL